MIKLFERSHEDIKEAKEEAFNHAKTLDQEAL